MQKGLARVMLGYPVAVSVANLVTSPVNDRPATLATSALTLLARWVSQADETHWILPGGRVEHGEDPFDAVIREVAEETGCDVEGRTPAGRRLKAHPSERRLAAQLPHQNVGIFYRVRITGGHLRPEPTGETAESV